MLRLVTKPAHPIRALSTLAKAKAAWGDTLRVLPEVEHALETGSKGVVALETAIVTHGMPHPTNYECALSVEALIREQSSIPATIALIQGKIHIGLTPAELARLSDPAVNAKSIKLSRRDLARGLYARMDAGTTVAGTMMLARHVGIDVFVTGGIGGVHRGAERSMDVSADLHELGRTAMGVVCAGAKSILDLGLTLEVLETLGVNVTTVGETDDFPAFYSPKSGFKSNFFVKSAAEAAGLLHTSLSLPTPQAQLFACPIPPQYHAQGAAIQEAVEQAVRESIEQGVDKRGKEVTPWLLKRVGELTRGKALESNIALIENNARIGGRIAAELNALKRGPAAGSVSEQRFGEEIRIDAYHQFLHTGLDLPMIPPTSPTAHASNAPPEILVFGSAAIDITSRIRSGDVSSAMHSTAPGQLNLTPGGVGRNIAECASRLSGGKVMLVSAVGAQDVGGETAVDSFGLILDREMKNAGMRTDGLLTGKGGTRTAVCNLILDDKAGLVVGVADMDIVESITTRDILDALDRHQPKTVAFDANLTSGVMAEILQECHRREIPVVHDPTSLPKMMRILPAIQQHKSTPNQRPLITHYTPNNLELKALYDALRGKGLLDTDHWWACIDSLQLDQNWRTSVERLAKKSGQEWIAQEGVAQMMVSLLPWVENTWLKCGDKGVVYLGVQSASAASGMITDRASTKVFHDFVTESGKPRRLILAHYAAKTLPSIVSTTGAGDSFVGGLLAQINGRDWASEIDRVANVAMGCAEKSLVSERAVGDVNILE
ncbi:hypothetical protein NCC49_004470 [Naganishia albida]|nr:hypothetical protein NCC49_004470 [Naganishia albida]